MNKLPEEEKKGKCFKIAFNTLLENEHGILVHGMVRGQGRLEGVEYSHAWVLIGNTVVDKTTSMENFQKGDYYQLGQIKKTKEYTLKEALEMIVKHEHYGPWDKMFENVL